MPGGEKVWYASLAGRTPETWKWLLVVERWDVVYINGMWSRKFSIIPLLFAREAKFRRIVAVRGMLASGMMTACKQGFLFP